VITNLELQGAVHELLSVVQSHQVTANANIRTHEAGALLGCNQSTINHCSEQCNSGTPNNQQIVKRLSLPACFVSTSTLTRWVISQDSENGSFFISPDSWVGRIVLP